MPVLSELIADVNPSVSTEGSSFTIAFRPASSTLPRERTTWTTVGSASGMADIASATALMNNALHGSPRCRPSANITTIVAPAAPAIHSVRVFICLVSGVSSFAVVSSMWAIWPTCVPLPVPVTIITPLPCVTGVCMNAMLIWSLGPRSSSGSVSATLPAGVLSPVRADSSICSELAAIRRPSAGTWSPAVSKTMSPTTSSSAGISASAPPRRTRAVSFIIDLSAFIALSALPCWRRPTTAFRSVIATRTTTVFHSLIASETTAAPTRMICM